VLAVTIGALAGGGLFYAIGIVVALYAVGIFAVVSGGDQTFTLVVAISTATGVVGGAWIGARVFRWLSPGLAEPREQPAELSGQVRLVGRTGLCRHEVEQAPHLEGVGEDADRNGDP
jgi:hypothetical protein